MKRTGPRSLVACWVAVPVMVAGCGPSGVLRSGASEVTPAPAARADSDTGDCASDGPTYEDLEQGVADSTLVVRGVATISEETSSVPGSAGAPGWDVQVLDSWTETAQPGDVVEAVGLELIAGSEPCLARLTEGAESLLLLSDDFQQGVYYPIVVMAKGPDDQYWDSDARIQPMHIREIARKLEAAGLTRSEASS